ncbi:transcriptional coactivator HFI1/ADA1 [Candida albicans P60002]|nr:transcriptional coactivator HFI1/ADA1 [Candida albicans P60002]
MTSQIADGSSTTTINPLKNGLAALKPTHQAHGTSTTTHLTNGSPKKIKSYKRLELERLIREFQNKLGKNWEKYHETLSLFLIGKLSRAELISTITPILKGKNLLKYHNKLLLLNFANSLKDNSSDLSTEFAGFWNKKAGKVTKNKNTQFERFKSVIMGLPVKERKRIIDISRDSGKKGKIATDIILTRHAILPKIPMIQDKEQQQLQVNNLVQWQQDVLNGINTPIATENYEIPDYDNLSRMMLMIMREHGLTGGLNPGVMEVMLLGLESHLKNIVETAIDVAKYRKNKYTNDNYIPYIKPNEDAQNISNENALPSSKDITLCIEDLHDTLEMYPHLVESEGPKLRLSNVMLENDDMINDDLNYYLPPKSIEYLAKERQAATTNNASTGTTNPGNNKGSSAGGSSAGATTNSPVVNKTDSTAAVSEKTDTNQPLQTPTATQTPVQTSAQAPASAPAQTPAPTPAPAPVSTPILRPDAHIGTTDELKWVLHDLVSTM